LGEQRHTRAIGLHAIALQASHLSNATHNLCRDVIIRCELSNRFRPTFSSTCIKSASLASEGSIGSKHSVAKELVETAPEEPGFVDRLRRENVGRLVFPDSCYDFSKREFVPEITDCLARVPFDFPERNEEAISECRRRIIVPILGSLEESMMTWLSRGLAGHVTDKDWAAFVGSATAASLC
jgi:hypothetical protein